jgi:multicomponent Na+:H+ antiporter subunit D
MGALDAGELIAASVLMLSSVLSLGYLLPIVGRAFFLPPPDPQGAAGLSEAPIWCLLALCATAFLCLALFFGAGTLERMLESLFLETARS